MMKVLIKPIALALTLTGCTPHILTTPPQVREAFIHFKIVDELPAGIAGRNTCTSTNLCTMYILEGYYPECLVHEFGHVTHKDWHGNTPTTCRYGSNFK